MKYSEVCREYWENLLKYSRYEFKTVDDFINGKEYNMKTQKITRKDLQTIYGQVCPDWQKKITELALWQSGDTIEVSESLIYEGWNAANVTQREMLKKYFKVVSGNILDEIDSFDDIIKIAREKYGRSLSLIDNAAMQYGNLTYNEVNRINADRKLELIELVLNEGWKADWNNSGQYKWTPWFKKEVGGWVAYGVALSFYYDLYAGVPVYFKDEKTAIFAGKKFLDIFKEILPA